MGLLSPTSAVEAEAKGDLLWVDVVAPEQLQRLIDLGQVGVGERDGADGWDVPLEQVRKTQMVLSPPP